MSRRICSRGLATRSCSCPSSVPCPSSIPRKLRGAAGTTGAPVLFECDMRCNSVVQQRVSSRPVSSHLCLQEGGPRFVKRVDDLRLLTGAAAVGDTAFPATVWSRAKPTSDTGHNAIEPLAALITAQHRVAHTCYPAEPDDDPWQKHLRRLHGDLIFGDHAGSTASHPPYDHVVELGKHLRADQPGAYDYDLRLPR